MTDPSRPADQRLTEILGDLAAASDRAPSREADAAELDALWSALGALEVPEPMSDPSQRFTTMIDAYRQGLEEGRAEARSGFTRPPAAGTARPAWQHAGWLAAAAGIALVLGLGLGRVGTAPTAELAGLRAEMSSLQRTVATSLLANGSASERLRAVRVARAAAAEDESVLDALVEAVRSDPSTNVRIAAIDALGPLVRQRDALRRVLESELRLVTEAPAGARQADPRRPPAPLVQIALVDSLLAAGEPGRQAILRLLGDAGTGLLDPSVRDHIDRRLARPTGAAL